MVCVFLLHKVHLLSYNCNILSNIHGGHLAQSPLSIIPVLGL